MFVVYDFLQLFFSVTMQRERNKCVSDDSENDVYFGELTRVSVCSVCSCSRMCTRIIENRIYSFEIKIKCHMCEIIICDVTLQFFGSIYAILSGELLYECIIIIGHSANLCFYE